MLRKKQEIPSDLDESMNRLYAVMSHCEVDSDEYATAVARLKDLHELKINESVEKKKFSVSPDALVAAAANLAGILVIVNYERVGVVTSKAIGFIAKLR